MKCLGKILGVTISDSMAELLNFPKQKLGRGAWPEELCRGERQFCSDPGGSSQSTGHGSFSPSQN